MHLVFKIKTQTPGAVPAPAMAQPWLQSPVVPSLSPVGSASRSPGLSVFLRQLLEVGPKHSTDVHEGFGEDMRALGRECSGAL